MKLKGENIDAYVFVQKKISFENENEGKVNVNIVKIWEKRLLITTFYKKENISKNGKGANIDAKALMKKKIVFIFKIPIKREKARILMLQFLRKIE